MYPFPGLREYIAVASSDVGASQHVISLSAARTAHPVPLVSDAGEASQCSMESQCLPEPKQFVSLLDCIQELLLECLAPRSSFISALLSAQDEFADSACAGGVKVPAIAAKDWIRGIFRTHAQLRELDDGTLVQCVKVSRARFMIQHDHVSDNVQLLLVVATNGSRCCTFVAVP